MRIYENNNGDSNIFGYDVGEDFIIVYFQNGTYKYTYKSAGEEQVKQMVELAEEGTGLNQYINLFCKYSYEQKGDIYDESNFG
jgi:hypothetical protein